MSKKYLNIVIIISTLTMLFSFMLACISNEGRSSSESTSVTKLTEDEEPIFESDSSENEQVDIATSDSLDVLTFDGELELKIVEDRIIVTIYSNVPDGGIFDILILNEEVKGQTDLATIKDEKIEKDFLIPKDWSSGKIAVLASFRFNVDSQPQPDHIIGIYGSKGEKMQGDLTEATSEGGKMGVLEASISYTKNKDIGYEIIHVIKDRFDGALTYYILISPQDLSTDDFKKDIEQLIRYFTSVKGKKVSLDIYDDKEALEYGYVETYGTIEQSLGIINNTEIIEHLALHCIANFDGELETGIYYNTLWFFIYADYVDNSLINKYTDIVEFNP